MSNKVLVITLNYNQSLMTIDCIKSVLASDYKSFEILIIDNGSENKDYENLLKEFNNVNKVNIERIIKNCGYVRGVNHGIKKALEHNPDFFLIMNNDTKIDTKAITYLVKTGIRYNYNAIVSGKIYHYDRPNEIQYVGANFSDRRYLKEIQICQNQEDIGQCDEEAERDMLDDIFWLLPNNIYQDIGDYSEDFFLYAEQADYVIKATQKGYKLIYTPKAKLWHKGSITTGKGDWYAPPVNYWRNKSSIIYLFKHIKKKHFIWFSIKMFIKIVPKLILGKSKKNRKSNYAAFIGFIHGILWIFNKKPDNGVNPFIKKK